VRGGVWSDGVRLCNDCQSRLGVENVLLTSGLVVACLDGGLETGKVKAVDGWRLDDCPHFFHLSVTGRQGRQR